MEEYKLSNRRSFIKNVLGTAAFFSLYSFPKELLAAGDFVKITVLHTNDWHSRIEPFPMDGGRNQGLGGAAYRASIISDIRKKESNVLLLDAGDVFQGTPYFNFFGGELEFKLMSQMGYDACTLGNHDFDAGLDGLLKQLPHAKFPFLIANYDFSNTVLKDQFKPYKIFEKQGIKIGVFGIGIELKGLVPETLYGDTQYLDPILNAQAMSQHLKHAEKCDLIICLSHLGYKYENKKVSDEILAASTKDIDLIIGGHTHTFMKEPAVYKNAESKEVMVFQVGWAGINLGRIDFFLEKKTKRKWSRFNTVEVRKKTN